MFCSFKKQSFIIKYDVSCMFFIDIYHIRKSLLLLGIEGQREELMSPELSNWGHLLGAVIVEPIQWEQKQGGLVGTVTIEET